MPQVSNELGTQYWEPVATGPMAQADISNWAALGTPTTIAASGAWNSSVLPTDGFRTIAVGVTSSQPGVLSVQRYLDKAGLVAQGGPNMQPLAAATSAVLNVNDSTPCQSFQITITNSGGSPATITNFVCLLNAQ